MPEQSFEDFYALLEVEPNATLRELDAAYKAAMRRWHPDMHVTSFPAHRLFAEQMAVKVNWAWDVLGDPDRRPLYDLIYKDWLTARLDSVQARSDIPSNGTSDVATNEATRPPRDFLPQESVDAVERVRKVLEMERETNCEDLAVVGGLDAFLDFVEKDALLTALIPRQPPGQRYETMDLWERDYFTQWILIPIMLLDESLTLWDFMERNLEMEVAEEVLKDLLNAGIVRVRADMESQGSPKIISEEWYRDLGSESWATTRSRSTE